MRHKKYDYSCVIIFWDSTCQATEEWIQRMGVRTLVRGENQPFYHVLVDDGSYRYAAEGKFENIVSLRFHVSVTSVLLCISF